MEKKCFKCGIIKPLDSFYKCPGMKDGHFGKCIECFKDKTSGSYECKCKVCGKKFYVNKSEFTSRGGKRGTGRKTCSRECWYKWNQEDNIYNFKGDNASYIAKHHWIAKKLGKPNYCEHCKKTDKKFYQWSNISGKYFRDVTDWQRLCASCHKKYDTDKLKTFFIKCIVCGTKVETKSKKRMFCSKLCSSRHYKKKYKKAL